MKIILLIISIISALISYSCCVIAGRADKEAQKMFERIQTQRGEYK